MSESIRYVPGPTPQEYSAEYLERELRGVSNLTQRVLAELAQMSFSFFWDPVTGLDDVRTVNVASVVPQGSGIYRVTPIRPEAGDRVLVTYTLPFMGTIVPSKTDEGTVTPIFVGQGAGVTPFYDVYLSETYIGGSNLREQPYTLVAGDKLYGIGWMPPGG